MCFTALNLQLSFLNIFLRSIVVFRIVVMEVEDLDREIQLGSVSDKDKGDIQFLNELVQDIID